MVRISVCTVCVESELRYKNLKQWKGTLLHETYTNYLSSYEKYFLALQNIEYEEEKFIVPIKIRHRMKFFFIFLLILTEGQLVLLMENKKYITVTSIMYCKRFVA